MSIKELMQKPVWQMTGEELIFLQNASLNSEGNAPTPVADVPKKRYEYSIRGIAKIFGCSMPTANRIKKSGKINAAITQIGRKIIVDVDLALQLAKSGNKRKGNI